MCCGEHECGNVCSSPSFHFLRGCAHREKWHIVHLFILPLTTEKPQWLLHSAHQQRAKVIILPHLQWDLPMVVLLNVRSTSHGGFGVTFLVAGDCSNAFLSNLLCLFAFLSGVLCSLGCSQTSYEPRLALNSWFSFQALGYKCLPLFMALCSHFKM